MRSTRLFVLAFVTLSACTDPGLSDDDLTDSSGTPGPTDTPASPTPTAPPAPTPPAVTIKSIDVVVKSATEVWLTLTTDLAVPVTLRYGATSADYSKSGSSATKQNYYLAGLKPSTSYQYLLSVNGFTLETGTFKTSSPSAGPFTVMFDAAHAETANNADWVIDDTWPVPSPSNPGKESDWKGAYSSWGFDLEKTGRYELVTGSKKFTYGSTSGDLASVDALVIPEPNSKIESSEITALQTFVKNGGGLFIISDHSGSDRNSDGLDSVEIWATVLKGFSPSTGISVDSYSLSESEATNIYHDSFDPVVNGSFGPVQKMEFNSGTTFHIDPTLNDSLQGLVWRKGIQAGSISSLWALRAYYGAGRIVAIGDSSPADDGTGATGDELYNSWSESGYTNAAFFLNATAWLVSDATD